MNNSFFSVFRLSELYVYDRNTGIICNKSNSRPVFPHKLDLTIYLWDPEIKLKKKILYKNAAYALAKGAYVDSKNKVLQLDLNLNNYAINNLKIVSKDIYREVLIALRNINGALRITQHKSDMHAYVLSWVEFKSERALTFYDVSAARAAKTIKELEFVKFINQHIPTQ